MNKPLVIIGCVVGAIALLNKKLMAVNTEFNNIHQEIIITQMAYAIAQWESGNDFNALSYKNNNPGNLKDVGQFGVIGCDSQGHAIFDTYQNGWNALIKQLQMAFNNTSKIYNSKMTLYNFFTHYAESNSKNYAEFVAKELKGFTINEVNANSRLENL